MTTTITPTTGKMPSGFPPPDGLLKSQDTPPEAGGANASIAEESLTGAGAAPVVLGESAADQAAAAMAAESAQILADAERSVDARKVASQPAPLVVLSEEVTFLARQLRQPPELVAQLLVLAEVRGLRADHEHASRAVAMVLS